MKRDSRSSESPSGIVRHLPVPILFILCLFVVSCATTNPNGREPRVQQQPTQVGSIDFYGTDLKFAWKFTNPDSREIHMLSYVWELQVDGKRVLHGQSRQVRRILAGSDYVLEIPVSIRHEQLEEVLHANPLPSQLPYRFVGKANLGAGVHAWSFALADDGKVDLLAGPQLDIQRFHIAHMDPARARVDIEIRIHNPNTFPTQLNNFSADLILAGQTIAQGVEGPSREIAPNGTAVVPLNLDLNFASLGRVVYRALNQEQSDYTLYGKTEVTTPWGVRKMNYDQSGKVTIER